MAIMFRWQGPGILFTLEDARRPYPFGRRVIDGKLLLARYFSGG